MLNEDGAARAKASSSISAVIANTPTETRDPAESGAAAAESAIAVSAAATDCTPATELPAPPLPR